MNKISILSIFIFASILVGCKNESTEETETNAENTAKNASENMISLTKTQFANGRMKFSKITEESVPEVIHATGSVDVPPENKLTISSYIDGYIAKVPFLIGDRVKAGQLIASIESTAAIDLQKDYLDAMNRLDYLKSEYQRQQKLFEEKITAEKNYLRAKSEYQSEASKVAALEKQMGLLNISVASVKKGNITSNINIYSPIDGEITMINTSRGKHVQPSDEIIQVVNFDHLHMELDLFEKDLFNIKKGQDVYAFLPDHPADTLKSEIHLVGKAINPDSRTIKIHAHFKENEDLDNLAIGTFLEAEINTGVQKAFIIPSESIVEVDGKSYILVLQDTKGDHYQLKITEVTTGKTYQDKTVINNAGQLDQNKQILSKGAFELIQ
ncbi:membrane fusion protein, cobalt-zinc-cadmium efflux system [Zunongwangia mangrovi]|uniref:Membrane fusion protein, cobalt-zinc-cadmium efflux system n=1 Tax=Zunongwangia mangrovi TaxID=1334022 RepID=A0A1I1LUU5_9FLAO|nr:efflux RND transporter periplasmic adaptor subunit [Zunongwangia mangrovi]SFC76696.1 membrane fusion protein, cobalt-zinc-cadmium efflux system [Zunongwangia mangrovi]